jgi:hypothetical protein
MPLKGTIGYLAHTGKRYAARAVKFIFVTFTGIPLTNRKKIVTSVTQRSCNSDQIETNKEEK